MALRHKRGRAAAAHAEKMAGTEGAPAFALKVRAGGRRGARRGGKKRAA
jgi:hypothetical protein